MSLRLIRFAVIMLAALSLSVGIGHLMELPARMAWDQDLWVGATAQGGFYALSGPLGVLLQVFTIIALIVLAVLLRRSVSGAPFTIAAAVMFAIGRLETRKARLREVEIDSLTVRKLKIIEEPAEEPDSTKP